MKKQLHFGGTSTRGSGYERPRLQRFGNVAELTQQAVMMGSGNSDGNMMDKTGA